MACLVIGDSLAVGVGQFRPECEVIAKVGITSATYLATRMPDRISADEVVISLGVNNGDSADTLANLQDVRSRITAKAVYWLLPGLKENVRAMIESVAGNYGDRTIDTRPEAGRDHLHPNGAGYRYLASLTTGKSRGDVEVAYAPIERLVPAGLATYRTRMAYDSVPRDGYRLVSTRERIRRLHMLRLADRSAPIVRRTMAEAPHTKLSLQHNVHLTATSRMVSEPAHVIEPTPRCGVHGQNCPHHLAFRK